jgi:hypothetical protein
MPWASINDAPECRSSCRCQWPRPARRQIRENQCDHPCKRELFWVLAGKDTKWIEDRLADGSVADPSELLGYVGFRPTDRPPIEEIAALFANRAGPELILASIPDTLSGDDVEVARYRLDESQKLAESDNADVRAVGEAGVRLYTSVFEAAKKRAREHELRSEIWY